MDNRRFDYLTKALASQTSRRQALKGVLGLGAATVTGGVANEATSAARRPTPTPKPVSCPGSQVWTGSACVCPEGRSACGPACCDSPAACCDNACCPGGTVCIGEEICCPAEAMCGGVCCLSGTCLGGVCCDAAFVCGDTCCTAEGFQCCGDACQQCCSDRDCAVSEYCSESGQCISGCNEDSDCAALTTGCIHGACQNNSCVAIDSCETGSCCGSVCLDCQSQSTFCLASNCDPALSECVPTAVNEQVLCHDPADKCDNHRCFAGLCLNLDPIICPPLTTDGCASTTCDSDTGNCMPAPPFTPDGAECPGGTCVAGSCCTECVVAGVCVDRDASGACPEQPPCPRECLDAGKVCDAEGVCVCPVGLMSCESEGECVECCSLADCSGEGHVCEEHRCGLPTSPGVPPTNNTCPPGSYPFGPPDNIFLCLYPVYCTQNSDCASRVCLPAPIAALEGATICQGRLGV